MIDGKKAYALARKYTDDSLAGAGAVSGVPCQIQSITPITGGNRVTYLWVDNNGDSHTSTMDVKDGANGKGIKAVAVNAENHLIITYSDDTTTDAGEIDITSAVNSVNDKTGDVVLTASDVGALPDNTSIPSKTSDITNDSGFITNAVNNLINYYLKSETYSKSEVNDLIGALSALTLEIVETLPVSDISTSTIYLVPVEGETNVYMQYIYVNNEWAQLGTTQADLTNYYTKTQIDASLLLKQDKLTFDSTPTGASVNPVTSGGVYTALGTKQDTLTFDSVPTQNSNNPVKSGGVYEALQNVDVPVATTQTAGKVKPDGTTITVDANGVISGANTLEGGNLVTIDNNTINAKIFVGTSDEWNALSVADKAKYTIVNLTDDNETGGVVDAVADGNMNAVTSNAVFDALVSAISNAFKPQYFNITWNEHVLLNKTRVTAFRMNNLVVITAYFETDGTVLNSDEIIGTVPEALKPEVEVEGTGMITHSTQGMQIGKWTIRISGNIQQLSTNSLGTINSFTFVYPINN